MKKQLESETPHSAGTVSFSRGGSDVEPQDYTIGC